MSKLIGRRRGRRAPLSCAARQVVEALEGRRLLAEATFRAWAGPTTLVDNLSRTFVPAGAIVGGGFVGGRDVAVAMPQSFGTVTDANLFRVARVGPAFSFAAPVNNGRYAVFVEFAGPDAAAAPGSRVFDVTAEGVLIGDDVDAAAINAAATPADASHTPVAVGGTISVVDGRLDVTFVASAGEATASAIVLVPLTPDAAALPYSSVNLSDTARWVTSASQLRQIGLGALLYANGRRNVYPTDLATAVRAGDVDFDRLISPRAATQEPRGALSLIEQTAFARTLDDYVYTGLARNTAAEATTVMAYENPDRAAGDLNVLYADGHVELRPRTEVAAQFGFDAAAAPTGAAPAYPALARDAAVVASQANLRAIAQAALTFASENRNVLPTELSELAARGLIRDPAVFLNPRLGSTVPTGSASWTTEQYVAWVRANAQYGWAATTRLSSGRIRPNDPLVFERPADLGRPGMGGGLSIGLGDGSVAFQETRYALETLAPITSRPPPPTNVGFDNYVMAEGATQTLFGYAGPLAPGQTIASWSYDYYYNGYNFTSTSSGQRPLYTAPDGPATVTIALRVVDNYGQYVTRAQAVRVDNVAPTAAFAAHVNNDASVTATFANPVDAAADLAAGLRYSFDFNNDGDFLDVGDVDRGTSPTATFTYGAPGTYTVHARISDKDGDSNKYLSRVVTTSEGNVAAGRLTTALGTAAGSSPSNATDLSLATEWVAEARDDAWVRVDLGRFYAISSIVAVFNNGVPDSFAIQTSEDGSTWTDAGRFAGNAASSATVGGPARSAQHVRVLFTQRRNGWSYRLGDLRVYGAAANPPPPRISDIAGPAPAEGGTSSIFANTYWLGGQSVGRWEWDFDYVGGVFTADRTMADARVTFDATNLDGPTTRVVAVRATDNFGQQSIATRSFTVANVAPAATFSVAQPAGAGAVYANFTNVVEPGAADRAAGLRYSVDFNNDGDYLDDGDVLDSSSTTHRSTAFAAPGTYAIRGQVRDKDGDAFAYAATFTVAGPSPTFSAGGVVFNDLDGDGVVDAGEPAVAGRTVFGDLDYDGALDAGEPTSVSGADGRYAITFAGPGNYQVGQVLPATLKASRPPNTSTTRPYAYLTATAPTATIDFGSRAIANSVAIDPTLGVAPATRATGAFGAATMTFLRDGGWIARDPVFVNNAYTRDELTRYRADGTRDATFGTNGTLTMSPGESTIVAEQADGRLVVAGSTFGGQYGIARRFAANGAIDTTFGTNGVTHNFTGLSRPTFVDAIAIAADGSVLIGARSQSGTTPNFSYTPVVTKLTAAGARATAFGADGTFADASATASTSGSGALVAATADGGVILKTRGDTLLKLTAAGAPDVAFGAGNGVALIKFGTALVGITSLAVQDDGRVLLSGYATYRALLARLGTDGRPDATFGASGIAALPQPTYAGGVITVPHFNSVVRLADGSYVAVGQGPAATNASDLLVAKFKADGTIDAAAYPPASYVGGGAYGGGIGTYAVSSFNDAGVGAALDTGGRLRIAVTSNDGRTSGVLRLPAPTPPSAPGPLAGTPIGTAGSYNNNGLTIHKAFDGDFGTYFDGPKGTGMWAGLDLGTAKTITSVQFAPRAGWTFRVVGGLFQGSNTADFSSGVTTLATVTVAPPAGAMTTLPVSNATAFRYVRFLSPTNGYGNVAELKFFDTAGTTTPTNPTNPTNPTTPTAGVLTGTPFGTAGSYNNSGLTIDKAFDGSMTSYVDLAKSDGNVIGLDFGAAKTVTQVRFAPRVGWAFRMVGGRFEASNVADFSSGVTTLHTVAAAPAEGVLTSVNVTAATSFRYVRYVAPSKSYGNVAEIGYVGTGGTTTPTNPTTPTQWTGSAIGTAGSYQNNGYTVAKAFDGDLGTYFDGPTGNGMWAGLDLGVARSITSIRYAPRVGWAGRMVGGLFQASNTADFSSGVVTLATVTARPTEGVLTNVNVTATGTYRYVRYLAPGGSYGNIAEARFFG